MAEEADPQLTFTVKSSADAKYSVTMAATASVLELKTKLSSSDLADIPTERQRLIYSGRVLKDNETLSSYKIKDGHTIHLVKGAESNSRQNPANQGGSATSNVPSAASGAGNVPTNLAAGTGAHNPLAQLTGARYAGFHQLPGADMFGADGGVSRSRSLRHLDPTSSLCSVSTPLANADSRRWEPHQILTNYSVSSRTPISPSR